MNKLSIGNQGIEIENHEKDNVMTVGVQLTFVLSCASVSLLLFANIIWIEILGAMVLTSTFIVILSVYISHNIKSPELLQSERYRLEKQKIEMGMITNKNEIFTPTSETLTTNINPSIEIKDREDIKE